MKQLARFMKVVAEVLTEERLLRRYDDWEKGTK